MPFAEPQCGAGRIYLAGWYGVMVDALKSLRSKISPARWFGVPMLAIRNGLAGLVMYAGRGNFPIFSNWIPIGKSWNQKKGTNMIPVEDLKKPHQNGYADNTLDADFEWLSKKNRQALYQSMLSILRNGQEGTPYEYTLLMPPLKKAHQFLSRDEKHRNWNGYIWENV